MPNCSEHPPRWQPETMLARSYLSSEQTTGAAAAFYQDVYDVMMFSDDANIQQYRHLGTKANGILGEPLFRLRALAMAHVVDWLHEEALTEKTARERPKATPAHLAAMLRPHTTATTVDAKC